MQNSNYVNIEKISQETNAFFDAFATGAKQIDWCNLNRHISGIGDFLPGNIQQVLKEWVTRGLIHVEPEQAMSIRDAAMLSVLTVLKKRGLSLSALRQIRDALNLPMYDNCSVLEFAILLCRNLALEQPDADKMPYLVIDGENRITLALKRDLNKIITDPDITTYSHIILNTMQIFNECDVVLKINASDMGEFVDIPTNIASKLYDPGVKKLNIDKTANRIHTVSDGGISPNYGERTIKYQNGREVFNEVKSTEVFYE